MSNTYKLFSKIITRRITKILDENQPQEQAGFRSGFSTIDHLQTVNQIMEKTREYNLELYIAFIDFAKAFDSVEHPSVLEALFEQGIERKYVRLLAKIYSNTQAKIRTDQVGLSFALQRGVRQGDPMSPKLFTCLLEHIFRQLDWQNRGIEIDGRRLSNLRFADDIILFTNSAAELQIMLDQLRNQCTKAGLLINTSKTKIITNGVEAQISIGQELISYVEDYVYLGQVISFRNSSSKEVKRRITIAWRKFWNLSFILLDKSLKIKIKSEILNKCILPALLYGAQTWNLTQQQKTSLQVAQRKMERKILQITLKDHIKNTEIRRKTQVKDASHTAQILKWRWAGHVVRLNHNRWAHTTTLWDPRNGSRGPGRPATRWADDMRRQAGNLWTRAAKDRKAWKKYEKCLK